MADIITITTDNFESEVIQSKQPVLLDFGADWCKPCKIIAPIVEAIANEYSGRLRVGEVDVNDNPRLATRFGIRSLPTLLLLKSGNVAEMIVGSRSKEQIIQAIERALNDGR